MLEVIADDDVAAIGVVDVLTGVQVDEDTSADEVVEGDGGGACTSHKHKYPSCATEASE